MAKKQQGLRGGLSEKVGEETPEMHSIGTPGICAFWRKTPPRGENRPASGLTVEGYDTRELTWIHHRLWAMYDRRNSVEKARRHRRYGFLRSSACLLPSGWWRLFSMWNPPVAAAGQGTHIIHGREGREPFRPGRQGCHLFQAGEVRSCRHSREWRELFQVCTPKNTYRWEEHHSRIHPIIQFT